MKDENMSRREKKKLRRGERGGGGGGRKQSAGKTYLGMRREIQGTSSLSGTDARHRDKKHMPAT